MFSIAIIVIALILWQAKSSPKSYARQLEKHLSACTQQGIIDNHQRQGILAYVSQQKSGLHLKGATWIGIFAGIFVAAGICLVIAHNWQHISPTMRVIGFVIIYALVGEASLRSKVHSKALSTGLQVLWFFLPIVGIGLYAQTFQLSGHPLRPFLVWIVLTLPLLWLSSSRVLSYLHIALMVAVLFAGNFNLGNVLSLITPYQGAATIPISAWLLSLTLLVLIAIEIYARMSRHYRSYIVGIPLLWLWICLAYRTPFQVTHEGWLMLATIACTMIGLLTYLRLQQPSSKHWPLAGGAWIACIYVMTFFWNTHYKVADINTSGIVLILSLCAIAIALLVTLPTGCLSQKSRWQKTGQITLGCSLVMGLLLLTGNQTITSCLGISANFFLIYIAVALMWHGSIVASVHQINAGAGILLLVAVTRYIDLFGNLLKSGVGFIITGCLLAAIAVVLEKGRRRLINRSGSARHE